MLIFENHSHFQYLWTRWWMLNCVCVCVYVSCLIFWYLKKFSLYNFSSWQSKFTLHMFKIFCPAICFSCSITIYFFIQFHAFSDILKCLIETLMSWFSPVINAVGGYLIWFSGTLLLFNIVSSPWISSLWSPKYITTLFWAVACCKPEVFVTSASYSWRGLLPAIGTKPGEVISISIHSWRWKSSNFVAMFETILLLSYFFMRMVSIFPGKIL